MFGYASGLYFIEDMTFKFLANIYINIILI